MGRQFKSVTEALRQVDAWIIERREFEKVAALLPDDDKRDLFRAFARSRQEAIEAGRIFIPSRPSYLRGFTCGARIRSGAPCRMTALFPSGRCIWHGGKSTGPRTARGRKRALKNLELGRRKRRELMERIK